MPAIYPFNAVQYHAGRGDVSAYIAPPYDVLDAAGKARLLHKSPRNVVGIDLPHTPAKELGPVESYEAAARQYHDWLRDGTLTRRAHPAVFAYRQTFDFAGGTHQRCGMACCVETQPFGPRPGGGILPHEETFSGPKEDRFALMKASQTQFSPIFGLHADERGLATGLVRKVMQSRPADMTGRMEDNVLHEVWAIDDQATIKAYADALAGEDVFIADGHHRYTTGLNYLKQLESQGKVPADHPARRCMMVLVGMSDPGLVIGPTHRVLGGMAHYTFEKFTGDAGTVFEIHHGPSNLHEIESAMNDVAARLKTASGRPRSVLGLIDFKTQASAIAVLKDEDPLAKRFPEKHPEWRKLDVALIQHIIVEELCQPRYNGGHPVKWAFPHSVDEVLEIGRGHETGAGGGKGFAQLAVVVRPTPLDAVKAVSKANQLMPQKSTFFYPKLATGLFINPLS
ncbi:MAG: DUF1015 domain-containing protein [Phycisphaerales bacterium]|nr:DUF1015 domain-containing protein [Phycisphaerales bacterium]